MSTGQHRVRCLCLWVGETTFPASEGPGGLASRKCSYFPPWPSRPITDSHPAGMSTGFTLILVLKWCRMPLNASLHFIDEETSGKSICLQCTRPGFDPWLGKISGRRAWQLTPVFLPGKSHGQRSLVDCSLWLHKELETTERHTHTHTHTHAQGPEGKAQPTGHGGVGDGRTEQLIQQTR